MKMREALNYITSKLKDGEEIGQTELSNRIYEITNGRYKKDSIYNNCFRNTKNHPEFFKSHIKIKKEGKVYWRRGKSEYHQTYIKPKEYFNTLIQLNTSSTIYTLCGTESHCCKVLDPNKTIKVDMSPNTKPDIKGDIFKIKRNPYSSYNLDYEGFLTERKIRQINSLDSDKILLTFSSSKNDILINKINLKRKLIKKYKSGTKNMIIYLLYN